MGKSSKSSLHSSHCLILQTVFTQLRGYLIEDQGLINNLNFPFSHVSMRKVNKESVNRDCGTHYHQPFIPLSMTFNLEIIIRVSDKQFELPKTQGISYWASIK